MKSTHNNRTVGIVILTVMCFCLFRVTQSQTVQSTFPNANNYVFALASSGTTVFLGGNFTFLSPYTGNGIAVNTTTGNSINTFPTISAPSSGITTAVPDGSGGFYIGGLFTEINGTPRTYIARLNSDGSLNAWNPTLDATVGGGVTAIAVSSDHNTVYVAGGFTHINSTERDRLAALSAADGSLTSWNPGLNGQSVNALSLSTTGTIYVAGSFSGAGGQVIGDSVRNRIAEISLSTGKATGWNPNVSSSFTEVLTIAQSASSVYIGGDFTQLGGSVTRNFAAKISKSSGIVNATWNPNAGYIVNTIVVSEDKVFIGGKFLNIDVASRSHLAVLDTINGTPLSGWLPEPDGEVKTLMLSGSTLYVGGDFMSFGGSSRARLASVDISSLTSVNLNSLNYGFGDMVNALALSGTTLYAGGIFTTAGGKQRNGLAAINGTTGAILDWDPNPVRTGGQSAVQSLVVSSNGGSVYVGGSFTSIGGQNRNNLAKIDVVTGNADATWNPNVDDAVEKMSLSPGDTLFFYGYGFTTVNGSVSRPSHLAAVKGTGTGEATAFNPDGFISATTRYIQVSPDGSTLYLGYNALGHWSSQERDFFAALNTSDGSVTDMNPVFDQGIFCSAIVGNTIYFGGQFPSMNGIFDIQKIAKFDASGGWSNPTLVTTWNNSSATRPDGDVRAILYSNTGSEPMLYLGGGFHTLGVTAREHYGAIKASDASVESWDVNGTNTGGALSVRMHVSTATNRIYIADDMTTILGTNRSHIAAVDGGSDPLPVELTTFTANTRERSVELSWKTATETNDYGFEVERSRIQNTGDRIQNGNIEWAKLGFVEGMGTSNVPGAYSYNDVNVPSGRYQYRLKQIDRDGAFKYSQSIETEVGAAPKAFGLSQNYPNPFNPSTTIEYSLAVSGLVSLRVYDVLGREVKTLVNERQETGTYSVRLDGSTLSSGIYYYSLNAGAPIATKKMLLLK